ncbi:MAG: peptide chain release factor N(5)-glutamine methyltransferase [Pseudomonadota bacterium]
MDHSKHLLDHLTQIIKTQTGLCSQDHDVIENPRAEARAIIRYFLSEQACFYSSDHIDKNILQRMENIAYHRAQHTPMAYLLGEKDFYNLTLKQSPSALIARCDSEILVESAISFVLNTLKKKHPMFLDLGTGSGCLLLACLKNLPMAQGLGSDCSIEALKLARQNAQINKLDQRCRFILSDWTQNIKSSFDVILCNPPYIPTQIIATLQYEVSAHEPHLALDGGPKGLDPYLKLAQQLKKIMMPSSRCFIEFGEHQLNELKLIFAAHHYRIIDVKKDLAGHPRCLILGL